MTREKAMIMPVPRKNLRTFFAIHFYMWAIVAAVGIIDAMRTAPVDANRVALCGVVIVTGIGLGSLLIRRPRL
jgi:hypothetical protein